MNLTKAKFTQTNWRIGVHYDSKAYMRSSGKVAVRCEVIGDSFVRDSFKYSPIIAEVIFGEDEEREANARLIASAPELLKTVEELRNRLAYYLSESETAMMTDYKAIEDAESLIKRILEGNE